MDYSALNLSCFFCSHGRKLKQSWLSSGTWLPSENTSNEAQNSRGLRNLLPFMEYCVNHNHKHSNSEGTHGLFNWLFQSQANWSWVKLPSAAAQIREKITTGAAIRLCCSFTVPQLLQIQSIELCKLWIKTISYRLQNNESFKQKQHIYSLRKQVKNMHSSLKA